MPTAATAINLAFESEVTPEAASNFS